MKEETTLNHVALQYYNKEQADIFFTEILKIPKLKEFTIAKELSNAIFKIKENVEVIVYANNNARFEVFITKQPLKKSYEHTCIEIDDKEEFIKCCNKHDLKPMNIQKDGKNLLFIRDFSNNLYEIKEKQK